MLPWMRAGASFHTGIAIGKFHGVISATTPTRATHRVEALQRRRRGVHLADRAPRLARREAEDRGGAAGLHARLAERLAHLRGHVLRDPLGARLDGVRRLCEERGAGRGGERRPGRKRPLPRRRLLLARRPSPDAWKTPVTSDGRHGFRFSYVSPESAACHSPAT